MDDPTPDQPEQSAQEWSASCEALAVEQLFGERVITMPTTDSPVDATDRATDRLV